LAVIAFHGLEDKIVKDYFKQGSRLTDPSFKLLTKKPVSPKWAEVEANPRSRSAKLRVIEKLPHY
jgi:16S rRNA (cytosine1402-N4)-methyltransferase